MTVRPSRYAHLTFNAPLSGQRADAMVRRLAAARPGLIVDLGCGWAELLLRLVDACPHAEAVGVDTDPELLARGRVAAGERGLGERVRLVEQDAATYDELADLVVCVGSSHVTGDGQGPAEAVRLLRDRVRPGGRLLLGEAFWEPHGAVDQDSVWEDMQALPDLGGLVDGAVESGFRPLWIETASPAEWEAFESGFLADDEEWLLMHPDRSEAADIRARADDHRSRWLRGYRHGLGFSYLTLGRPV